MSAIETRRHTGGSLPLGVLIAAGALISFTIGAALFSHASGVGRVALPAAAAVETLQLRFADESDGSIQISDAERGDVIHVIQPGVEGFIRATVRTMAQARKRDDGDAQTPFRLTRWSDGTLSFDDPKTGRDVGLDSFGPTNSGAFAQLFRDREDLR